MVHQSILQYSLCSVDTGIKDLTISITTNYYQHYLDSGVIGGMSRLNIQDFRVLIPKDEVETISFFDTYTYNKIKEDEERDKKDSSN